jgi:2'-5' RNA ligase
MPYAVTLRLDAATNGTVTTLLRALAESGVTDDRLTLGYPAHVTLAVFDDDADVAVIDAALCRQASHWCRAPAILFGFGVFPAKRSIVFLTPVVSITLLGWHADLHAAIPGLTSDPHYEPGVWVPHVTLVTISDLAAAFAVLEPLWPGSIAGHFAHAELVRFPPVDVLRHIPLSDHHT